MYLMIGFVLTHNGKSLILAQCKWIMPSHVFINSMIFVLEKEVAVTERSLTHAYERARMGAVYLSLLVNKMHHKARIGVVLLNQDLFVYV